MNKILILFAHPITEKAPLNEEFVSVLKNMKNITYINLYALYPDYNINIEEQQKLLIQHDIISFYHPFLWFSTPAILKEWQDRVLQHGWAFGEGGDALSGKVFFNTITAGGHAELYTVDGFHDITMRNLLIPIEKTAKMCKMIFLPPFIIHSAQSDSPEKLKYHKVNYHELLELLIDGNLDIQHASKLDFLNDYLIKEKGNLKKHV